jgi:hypothetical protein
MPFVYSTQSAMQAQNYTTSGSANTETEPFFLKPGTRNIGLQAMYVGGKGAGLTSISGIAYRLKKWTSTSASGGTALTPTPRDPGMQAAKATSGIGTGGGTAVVTVGTGGPIYIGGCISGAAGPGGWVAPNADSLPTLEGSANQSIDLFVASGTVSLNYEFVIEHVE